MILTVTYNPAVDQTVRFDEPLRPETVNRASSARYDPGGKGINVSQYLHALDAETVAAGLLGGFTGDFVRGSLDEQGLATDFVEIAEPTRVNTTALAADGEYKLNQAGSRVSEDAVDELVGRIAEYEPDYVHVAGSLPPGLDASAIDAVANAGDWETVVDVTGELLGALDSGYDLATPNRAELAEVTGQTVSTVEECASAAEQLRADGFDAVLASLGADGALLVRADEVLHAEPLAVEVVDTVGAGDSLAAGYLAGVDGGERPEVALRTGIVAASRVVARAGTSVPSFDDVVSARGEVAVSRL